MHLEENIEVREQKPHRWSIGDPSESNDHGDEGDYGDYQYAIDEMRKRAMMMVMTCELNRSDTGSSILQ